jgi:hypothetical protein
VRDAAAAQGYPYQDIISGAGHDAVYMARIAPTAMIFVPCVGGISHNEIEDAKPADLTAGCNMLPIPCSTGRMLVQTRRTRSPRILGLSVQRLIFNSVPLTLTVWKYTQLPSKRN